MRWASDKKHCLLARDLDPAFPLKIKSKFTSTSAAYSLRIIVYP